MSAPSTIVEHWPDAADPRRRIGRAVEFVAVIGSTNDRARQLLADHEGEGIAVVADRQVAGRGRHGRAWQSSAGRNLTLSVGLRSALVAGDAWLVSAAAALAVRAAAAPHAELAVKWPNDLVAADGRKVGGILVETTLDGEQLRDAVVGIGINVNWRRADMPPEIADSATSLADLAGVEVPRVDLLARLLDALDRELAPEALGDDTRRRYAAASALDGREVAVDTGEGVVRGVVRGIGDDGSLLVESAGTRTAIGHGEVVRVGMASPAEDVR